MINTIRALARLVQFNYDLIDPISRIQNNHTITVTMSAMASKITGVSIVCSAVSSGADQRKRQSSTSLTGTVPSQRASKAENVFI